jgi:hypothetical protein
MNGKYPTTTDVNFLHVGELVLKLDEYLKIMFKNTYEKNGLSPQRTNKTAVC